MPATRTANETDLAPRDGKVMETPMPLALVGHPVNRLQRHGPHTGLLDVQFENLVPPGCEFVEVASAKHERASVRNSSGMTGEVCSFSPDYNSS